MTNEPPANSTSRIVDWWHGRHPSLRDYKLNLRIITVYTISLLILVVTIGFSMMYFAISTEVRTWQSRQAEAAQTAAEIVAKSLQDNITHLYLLESFIQKDDFRLQTPVDKIIFSNPALLEVNVLDDKGKVLYSKASGISFLSNPFTTLQSVWYQQALSGSTYLGELQRSRNELPYLVLAVPAMEEDEVIVARLDMQILGNIINNVHLGNNGSAYLINQEGLVITHQDAQIPLAYTNLKDRQEISAILNKKEGNWSGIYVNFQEKPVMGLSHPIRETNWILVTEIPILEAFETSVKAFSIIIPGLGGFFLLAMVVGIRFLHTSLFAPINNLQFGAARIADGNLDQPIPVMHEDELGKVAQTLNTMSERLKERTQELEARTRSLAEEVAERQKAEDQIHYDAFHDSLTHLANRALLMDRLRISLLRTNQRSKSIFAVLFIDFDRFKNINDSLGHAAGDQVLIQTAQRLEQSVRGSDTVARLAADEFVIIIEDINSIHDATYFTDRLVEELGKPYWVNDQEISISFSTGIALSSTGYANAEDILRDADTAMHRAKRNGKARVEIFDPEMREHIMEHLSLESDLRKAIDSRQFLLYYQPVVDLRTNTVHGFEALVRWQHPVKGLIMPDSFIPMAEETGLIVPIGEIVLFDATAQLKEWQEKYYTGNPLKMSINLSRRQLAQEDLVANVETILNHFQMDPGRLSLEITETAYMHDIENGKRTINQLKKLGVEIHLDDFGTGYSSLSQLSLLSLDVVKIDRFFIDQMMKDEKHAGLVRAMISMAHELGMEVIAEGVETTDQMEMLASLGCEYGQGYLFARPQENRMVENLISRIFMPSSLNVFPS